MKKILLTTYFIFSILFLIGCEFQIIINRKVSSRTYYAMSTYMEVKIYEEIDDTILDDIGKIYKEYNDLFDAYKSYEGIINIKDINDHAGQVVEVGEELRIIIERSIQHYRDTKDYFNPLLGKTTELWKKALEDKKVPNEIEIETSLLNSEPEEIKILDNTIKIPFNSKIDLGGMAKGYVTDRIVEYLKEKNITKYMINSGTSSISCGVKNKNDFYKIGVTNPYNENKNLEIVSLKNEGISVSSFYHQYFIDKDTNKKYHHIINPKTGYPENIYDLVYVIGKNNELLDIASTALYSMTIDEIKDLSLDCKIKIYKDGQVVYEN